jgi:dTDP-4-amino-4,6-dideoxygalactose transaminase
MIPVTKPYIPNIDKYVKFIQQANSSEWLTNFGPLHNELTSRLEEWLGVKNLLLVSNGTLALQIAYKALGLSGDVLTTPFSFVATTSTLLWENLNPIFCDINKHNLTIDPGLLSSRITQQTTGVLGVHVYGNPCDVDSLNQFTQKNNLKLIYDGAHAFGVKKNGKSILLEGDASTLSLHATKVFHTVEGGAIIFKKKSDYEKAKQLINFGLNDSKEIVSIGINSKLNEYQAAVGLALLDEMDSIIEKRVFILNKYLKELQGEVEFPECDSLSNQNGAYAPVILKNQEQLTKVVSSLASSGFQTRRYFYPSLNTVKAFGEKVSCPVSEDIASRVLCLPMYADLKKEDQDKLITNLKRSL